MFSLNTLNSPNEMNNMKKKIYSCPKIFLTNLDSEINILLCSVPANCTGLGDESGMGLDGTNETDGLGISQFMNPLKWFR
jgi:hypothetical protein